MVPILPLSKRLNSKAPFIAPVFIQMAYARQVKFVVLNLYRFLEFLYPWSFHSSFISFSILERESQCKSCHQIFENSNHLVTKTDSYLSNYICFPWQDYKTTNRRNSIKIHMYSKQDELKCASIDVCVIHRHDFERQFDLKIGPLLNYIIYLI